MTHSHMPVEHLLKQIESFEPRSSHRDPRPEWITGLIDNLADLFEPVDLDVGRVGFDCQCEDDRWIVGMYVGGIEVVGGPDDGTVRHTAFRFDVALLSSLFDEIDVLHFAALPGEGNDDTRASIHLEGRVGGETVRLRVYAIPPTDAGPAFREMPDGSYEPV